MNNIRKYAAIAVFAAVILILLSACGEKRVSMSKSLYVINETDVTVTSLILDVEGRPLDEPIEVLSGPLEAGCVQQVVISLPEKQARNAEWVALAVTEKGAEYSKSFTVGDMNPHGENPLKGFYVKWFDSQPDGHYSVGVTFETEEEVLAKAAIKTDIPFVADESLVGDPPEGALSVFEAQKLLAEEVLKTEKPKFWETQGLLYVYRGIETDEDGAELYRIDLGVRDASGKEIEPLRYYWVGLDGAIESIPIEDKYAGTPENAADASWWGTYRSDANKVLGIVNYSGKSFRFAFYEGDVTEFDGAAAVYENNVFQAEFMDLVFTLSLDSDTVTVTQDKEDNESPQAVFAGEYHRE